MSVIQAALIALCYAVARSALPAGLGPTVLSQPIVAGALAGLILGEPARGAALGAALNLGTLGLSSLRLRSGPDIGLIGYVGVPLLLFAGAKPDSAVAAAVLAGLAAIGGVLAFLVGTFNSVLAHWADYFAERGEPSIIVFLNVVPSQLFLFVVTFFPALALLLSADAAAIKSGLAQVPDWAVYAMTLFQRLLALLGIAMALRAAAGGSAIAYAGLGWLAAQLLADGGAPARLVPLALVGACVSVIHAYIARRVHSAEVYLSGSRVANTGVVPLVSGAAAPPPAAIGSAFLLWLFFGNAAANYERGQNIGMAAALAPLLGTVYPGRKRLSAALQRNLAFVSTEPTVGAALVGALAAAEARHAAGGGEISAADLAIARSAGMAITGPVGDALVGGLSLGLFTVIAAAPAAQGSLLGPIIFMALQSAVILGGSWFAFQAGHRWVSQAIGWAEGQSSLRAGAFAIARLGAFVLGALIVRLAPISFEGAGVIVDGARVAFQPWLDAVLPRAIPLAITAWLWWRLRDGRASPATLAGVCAAGALVVTGLMKALGWL